MIKPGVNAPVEGSRLDLTIWTPLVPERSGIASYNSELLLPALARLAELTVVVDDAVAPLVDLRLPCRVVAQTEYDARPDGASVSLYQMGNHGGFHAAIHDALIKEPGVVVL